MEKKRRVGRIEKWGKRRYGFLGFSFSFLLYGYGRDSRELKVEKYKMNIRLVTLKKKIIIIKKSLNYGLFSLCTSRCETL